MAAEVIPDPHGGRGNRVAIELLLVVSTAMLIVLLILWAGDGFALSSFTNARLSMAVTYLLLRSAMIVTDLASIFGDFSLLLFCILSLLRFSKYFFSCIYIPNVLSCSRLLRICYGTQLCRRISSERIIYGHKIGLT